MSIEAPRPLFVVALAVALVAAALVSLPEVRGQARPTTTLPTTCERVGQVTLRTTDNTLWVSTATPGCNWIQLPTGGSRGSASVEIGDQAGTTQILLPVADTYVKWSGANSKLQEGIVQARINDECTNGAPPTPYPCCTGVGTGTCSDVVITTTSRCTFNIASNMLADTNAFYTCTLFVDGVEEAKAFWRREFGSNAAIGSASWLGQRDLTVTAGTVVDMRCKSDANNKDITAIYTMTLTASCRVIS